MVLTSWLDYIITLCHKGNIWLSSMPQFAFLSLKEKCILRRTVTFITIFSLEKAKKKKNPNILIPSISFLITLAPSFSPQLHNSLAPQSIDNTNLFTVPHLPHIFSSLLTYHHNHHHVYITISPAPLLSHYTHLSINPTTPSVHSLSPSPRKLFHYNFVPWLPQQLPNWFPY